MNPHLELTSTQETLTLNLTLTFQNYTLDLPEEQTQEGIMVSGMEVSAPTYTSIPLTHLEAAHKATANGNNYIAAQISKAIEEVIRVKKNPLKVGDRVRITLSDEEYKKVDDTDNPNGHTGTITRRYEPGPLLQSGDDYFEFEVSVDQDTDDYRWYPDFYHAHELEKIND